MAYIERYVETGGDRKFNVFSFSIHQQSGEPCVLCATLWLRPPWTGWTEQNENVRANGLMDGVSATQQQRHLAPWPGAVWCQRVLRSQRTPHCNRCWLVILLWHIMGKRGKRDEPNKRPNPVPTSFGTLRDNDDDERIAGLLQCHSRNFLYRMCDIDRASIRLRPYCYYGYYTVQVSCSYSIKWKSNA